MLLSQLEKANGAVEFSKLSKKGGSDFSHKNERLSQIGRVVFKKMREYHLFSC